MWCLIFCSISASEGKCAGKVEARQSVSPAAHVPEEDEVSWTYTP
jgi:hypothetical protein